MKNLCVIEIGEQYLKIAPPQSPDCYVERIAGLAEADVVALLKEIIKVKKIRAREVAVCLPRNNVTSRTVHLPSQDPREIAQMVELHLTRIVPYVKEDIRFMFTIVGTDELQYARVLLTIVHKDMVQKPINILEKCGLLVERVTLSTGGVRQWALRSGDGQCKKNELYLALDIDAAYADFIVFNTEFVLFTRSIGVAAQELGSAESATKFIGELRQSLLIFNSEETATKLKHIYVSGTVGEQLVRMIAQELAIPVSKLPPGRRATAQNNAAVSLAAVSELALEGADQAFSFKLPELEIRKTLKQRMKEAIIMGSLLIYLLTVGVLIFFSRTHSRLMYVQQLQEYSRNIEQEMGESLSRLDQLFFIKNILARRGAPLYIFSQIQSLVGNDVAIELINMEKGNLVTVRGYARAISEVFSLVGSLEEVSGIDNVQTRYTRKKTLADKSEAIDFGITFTIGLVEKKQQGAFVGG